MQMQSKAKQFLFWNLHFFYLYKMIFPIQFFSHIFLNIPQLLNQSIWNSVGYQMPFCRRRSLCAQSRETNVTYNKLMAKNDQNFWPLHDIRFGSTESTEHCVLMCNDLNRIFWIDKSFTEILFLIILLNKKLIIEITLDQLKEKGWRKDRNALVGTPELISHSIKISRFDEKLKKTQILRPPPLFNWTKWTRITFRVYFSTIFNTILLRFKIVHKHAYT